MPVVKIFAKNERDLVKFGCRPNLGIVTKIDNRAPRAPLSESFFVNLVTISFIRLRELNTYLNVSFRKIKKVIHCRIINRLL